MGKSSSISDHFSTKNFHINLSAIAVYHAQATVAVGRLVEVNGAITDIAGWPYCSVLQQNP